MRQTIRMRALLRLRHNNSIEVASQLPHAPALDTNHGESALSESSNKEACPAGIKNLLRDCISVQPGERVLFVGEPTASGYFDEAIYKRAAAEASRLGANVELLSADPVIDPSHFPIDIARAIENADHTLFFSRLGDQMRFCPLPGDGTKTMCYLPSERYLNDPFAEVPHALFRDVHDELVKTISRARGYRITCRNGTDLEATLDERIGDGIWHDTNRDDRATRFTVQPFPVMIFPPLPCTGMSGRLSINHWLTSTGTHENDDCQLQLASPIIAEVCDAKLGAFHGDAAVVRATRQFYQSKVTGESAWQLNSWHTGIYPKTFYEENPAENPDRWGNLCFGNPRFTHFHSCGDDPGLIAICLIDASISFDNELLWENGRFRFLEFARTRALLSRHGVDDSAFAMRWDIGIDD